MFSRLLTLKKYSSSTITIDELIKIVKNNPQEELIQKIRSVEYKSTEYNNLKLSVNAITPHGTFTSLKNKGLVKLSNYFFYDIDGFDTLLDLNDTKQKLIDTNLISFLCKSVGGKGLSFLIKIDNDTKLNPNDTFINKYSFIRDFLIDMGFNIDKSAGGLVRKMIISSDKDIYFNDKAILHINTSKYLRYIDGLNKSKKIRIKEDVDINPNDTFNIIPFSELTKQIKLETLYTKEINGDYVIEEMDYYKIVLPRIIKDGTKHTLYVRIINALYYINNNINRQQIYSYLYYVNSMANPPMIEYELKRLITNICNYIEETGEIKIKPRVKRLHFNKNMNIDKKIKMSMGAKLSANIKKNKSLKLIEEARQECLKLNIIPTQKKVVELTGLSIATVKRLWNKDIEELKLEIPTNIKEDEIETINENEFFTSDKHNEEFYELMKTYSPSKRIEEKEQEDFGDGIEIEDFIIDGSKI